MHETTKPHPDDFDDYDQYLEALTEYKVSAALDPDHAEHFEDEQSTDIDENPVERFERKVAEKREDRRERDIEDDWELSRLKAKTNKDGEFKNLGAYHKFHETPIDEPQGPSPLRWRSLLLPRQPRGREPASMHRSPGTVRRSDSPGLRPRHPGLGRSWEGFAANRSKGRQKLRCVTTQPDNSLQRIAARSRHSART